MSKQVHTSVYRNYQRYAQVAGAFGAVAGVLVLGGWLLDIAVVKSLIPGLATMKFNTALCFCLSGVALWCLHCPEPSSIQKQTALVCAIGAGLIAQATLCQYLMGSDLGIDQLFVTDHDTAVENYPGRMSVATTVCFILLETALILLSLPSERDHRISQFLALGSVLGGLVGVEGYLLETSALYSFFWFSTMAAHTSLLFIVLGTGTLAARANQGIIKALTSKSMGGRMARRMLPIALILPALLGWLLLKGVAAEYFKYEMLATIFAAATTLVFAAIIWIGAHYLNETYNDLIQRNLNLEEAEKANAHLAAIVASSKDAIISTDLNGTISSWNDGAERIFGYQASEIVGQPVSRLIPEDHMEDEKDVLARIRQGENTDHYETIRQRKDGQPVHMSITVSPIRNAAGKLTGASKIARDIREQKQVEAQLQASLREVEDLKAALDEHAIVAITDPRGKITYVNDKFCAISKYSREELLGQDHRIINSGYHSKEFIRDLWETIGQGKVWHGEIRNRAKDGTIYWVDTTIVPFADGEGKPRQYVAIRADITERVQATEALARQAQELERSNKDLEQFAYAASHDLQEPLRAVGGCTQLLQKRYQGKIDERADEYIGHVVDGVARMQTLIHDLLEYSRVGTRGNKMQALDLGEPLDSALKNLAQSIQENQAEITRDPMPTVSGDSTQLTRLFQNLISNAIKFHGKNPPQIHIGAEAQGAEWVIHVHDNGIGIEQQYFERVFGIFQRLHTRDEYPGTGIGLALCKRIVERHGGRMWVESSEKGGSQFFFTLREA